MSIPLDQTREPKLGEQFIHLGEMIGNTPMLLIECSLRGETRRVYAKAEYMNLTGSIKDRMALHILKEAYSNRRIKPGDTIVEATSGNTGISFSAIGRSLRHPVIIFMPDWMSRERASLIGSLGATVHSVSREEGGFLGSIRLAELYAGAHVGSFLPRQFSNSANVSAHEKTTGPEIAAQLAACGVTPHAFVAGVGTGGTIMGVGRFLRSQYPSIRVHPLEPQESPTLSTGYKVGLHRIQGVSDEFIPDILKLTELDRIISVSDGDAILMAQKLGSQLGLGVGISSGANFLGALIAQETLGRDACVVTVFCDDNKKYLSTDLMRQEPAGSGYRSLDVELCGYKVTARANLPAS